MVSNMKIQRARKEKTQTDLSRETDIPQWRISLIERGIPANDEEKQKIAAALGCTTEEIFPKGEVKNG